MVRLNAKIPDGMLACEHVWRDYVQGNLMGTPIDEPGSFSEVPQGEALVVVISAVGPRLIRTEADFKDVFLYECYERKTGRLTTDQRIWFLVGRVHVAEYFQQEIH